eukprot:COSAG01_NODE_1376_length_10535_cov_103.374856_3_plen_47_part_00
MAHSGRAVTSESNATALHALQQCIEFGNFGLTHVLVYCDVDFVGHE